MNKPWFPLLITAALLATSCAWAQEPAERTLPTSFTDRAPMTLPAKASTNEEVNVVAPVTEAATPSATPAEKKASLEQRVADIERSVDIHYRGDNLTRLEYRIRQLEDQVKKLEQEISRMDDRLRRAEARR